MSLYVESKSDKRIRQTASFTVLVLAISSGVLSYNALRELAIKSGIDPMLAFLFPITLDGLILAGSLLILYFAVRGKRSGYGLFLTALGVVASIAGNVVISPDNLTYQILHATSPVVLFLSLESLMILLRARSRNAQEAAEKELAENKLHENRLFHHKTPSQEPSKTLPEAVVTNPPAPVTNASDAPEKTVEDKPRVEAETVVVPQKEVVIPEAKIVVQDDVIPTKETSFPESLQVAVPKSEPVYFEAEQPEVKPVSPVSPVSLVPAIKDQPAETATSNSGNSDDSQPPSKREIIRDLLEKDPEMEASSIVEIVGGDKKYVQKLIRAERAKIAS